MKISRNKERRKGKNRPQESVPTVVSELLTPLHISPFQPGSIQEPSALQCISSLLLSFFPRVHSNLFLDSEGIPLQIMSQDILPLPRILSSLWE